MPPTSGIPQPDIAAHQPNSFAARTPMLGAAIALVLGAASLLGWLSGAFDGNSDSAARWIMRPNSAAGVLLAGIAVWTSAKRPARPATTAVALAAAATVAFLGSITLSEHFAGRDLKLDHFLIPAASIKGGDPSAYRMAPTTAACFVLLGMSLLLWATQRSARLVQALGLAAGTVALLSLVSHAYGVGTLYKVVSGRHMSVPTGMALLALVAGILALDPSRGLFGVLTSKRASGSIARRLLPVVIVLPIALGYLRLLGERRGLYDATFGVSLMVVLANIAFCTLYWITLSTLDRAEEAREQTEALLRSSQARHAKLFEANVIGTISGDLKGSIREANDVFLSMVGYTRADLPLSWKQMTPPDWQARNDEAVAQLRSQGTAAPFEKEFLHKNGTRVPVLVGGVSVNAEGEEWTGFALDLTERKKAEAQLITANKELEAFCYSVSHDLRAPLRHIDGFTDLLRKSSEDRLDESDRRYLGKISQAARRMGLLIDDLLSFARMARVELQLTRVPLGQVVEQAVAEHAASMNGHPVRWKIGELPSVSGDPAMLHLAVSNLLSNALKYSRNQDTSLIEVGASEGPEETTVWVRDNGVGFDPSYTHKLFGVFQRLHGADEFEGTGIGLANVRRIIQRHGGRTWAEGAIDQGAAFYFTIPKQKEAA